MNMSYKFNVGIYEKIIIDIEINFKCKKKNAITYINMCSILNL